MFSKVCNIDSCEKNHHPLLHSQEFAKKCKGVKDDCTAKRSLHVLPDGNHESNPCSDKTTGQQSVGSLFFSRCTCLVKSKRKKTEGQRGA